MSIQAECREAMNALAQRGQPFTEIDVANEAAKDGWSGKLLEQAVKDAYNVLQGEYKKGRLVRFGPVKFQGVEDYARRASKIIYADAKKGPAKLDSPNGAFPRLFAVSDPLSRAGRRAGTNRDDTKSWEGQKVTVKKGADPKGPPVDPQPLLRRIQQLEAENRKLRDCATPVPAAAAAMNGTKDPIVALALSDVADLLVDKLAQDPRLTENVRNSLAEALIS